MEIVRFTNEKTQATNLFLDRPSRISKALVLDTLCPSLWLQYGHRYRLRASRLAHFNTRF